LDLSKTEQPLFFKSELSVTQDPIAGKAGNKKTAIGFCTVEPGKTADFTAGNLTAIYREEYIMMPFVRKSKKGVSLVEVMVAVLIYYFLEPSKVDNKGAQYKDARTPLDLGDNRVYYVDGDVWVHSPSTYGFLIEGQVTIVATGNIHISDNIKYADCDSLLGLVALDKYDGSDQLVSGGNIYFGDPRFGTMSTASAFMFAADSFLYNMDAVSRDTAEPTGGISIYGNLNALNQVSIERDWYKPTGAGGTRLAYFDPSTDQWVDLETGTALTANEINSISHYQMAITYDDRVRTQETQPPGLPRAKEGTIFGGLKFWQELPGR